MKAVALLQRRVVIADDAFVELVVWRVNEPLAPSTHLFKYRLAYAAGSECVVLYDNVRGKGDHRHFGTNQRPYAFSSAEQLLVGFDSDITRWNHKNGRT